MIEVLSQVLVGLGFVVFAAGMVRGKVVATELMLTLQMSYFGLAIVKYTDPMYYSMKELKYFNGYNNDFGIQSLVGTSELSSSFNSMDLK